MRQDKGLPSNIIVRMIFGSQLYGTSTATSDSDFKGVFMPTKNQIFLNKVPKSIQQNTKHGTGKNTTLDTDMEVYSLHYFLKLACDGETVALDMLHAPDEMLLQTSGIWERIVSQRSRFYTKNLKSFVRYARRQASKYGIKGSRLNDAKKVLDFCNQVDSALRLKQVWDQLPTGDHIVKHNDSDIRMYEVCGRKIGETVTIHYFKSIVEKFYKAYGKRAEQAAKNEGIDWKAVSHALRAAYQTKQILTQGTIIFPLPKADYLRRVKEGKLNYKNDVAPYLESLMDEVEELSRLSSLPLNVDREYWDNFLISVVEDFIRC